MNKYPISRKANIVVQEVENELLVYDLSINKAFCLNQISALVYQLCDGTRTVADIRDELSKRLKTLVSEELIWLALDGLKKDNLLENNEQFEINFNGLSRRQVIKKVGFASMVMLPLISSVLAPSAAMAQSGLSGLHAACTSPSQCQSGNCFNNTKCCSGITASGIFASGSAPGAGFCLNTACNSIVGAQNCCSGVSVSSPPTFCQQVGLFSCVCL